MTKNMESKNIEQLLAEADALIQQFNTDALKDLAEEHREQFEKHSQSFKAIKSGVQGRRIEQEGTPEDPPIAEDMHAAIQGIVKAMQDLKKEILG